MNNYVPNPIYDNPYYQLIDYKKPLKATASKIGITLILLDAASLITAFIFLAIKELGINVQLLTDQTTTAGQLANMTSYSFMFIVPILIGYKMINMPAKSVFSFRKVSADILFGSAGISLGIVIFGGYIVAFIYQLMGKFTGYVPVYPFDYNPRGLTANILFFINVAILPAFLEELLFRGVVMQSLRRYGDSFALITSAIIFGFGHGNLIQAPNAIVLGLILGYFVLYTGSLWPGIFIHFVNNGLSVVMQWIEVNTTSEQETVVGIIVIILRIVIGITCLVWLKMKKGSLFFIPPSQYPLKEREKYKTMFTSISVVIFILIVAYFTVTNLKPVSPEDLIF